MTDSPAGSTASGARPTPDAGQEGGVLVAVARAILRPVVGPLTSFGQHMILLGQTARWLVRPPYRAKQFLEQMEFVGVGSLPIIVLVGLFAGMVASLQAVLALRLFQQERYVGFAVGVSLAREIAPVFTALMITARAGSGMATELGSMRITEQVDALTTFAVNPIQYLVAPRIVATILMMPIMTMVFNVVGIAGAYLFAVVIEKIDYGQVVEIFRYRTDPLDYEMGLIKSVVFGLALSLAACYQGFNVRGGAKEVGLATTRAVVAGSVATLVLNFFLSDIFTVIWPSR